MMRAHILQHAPYEGLGAIADWLQEKNSEVRYTRFFDHDPLPSLDTFDWLIVMGGPMGVYDEARYPWLTQEIACVEAAIRAQKTVLGICLGSQIIAKSLGARVYPHVNREIGWFPVSWNKKANSPEILQQLPHTTTVFHWHGDTFDLPLGAVHVAQSLGCAHQAFAYGERVLGLQFHVEMTLDAIEKMVQEGAQDLEKSGSFVQTADEIRALSHAHIAESNRILRLLLDGLCMHRAV